MTPSSGFHAFHGNEISRVQRALAVLVDDPEQLDHARNRFDGSPPRYRSPSGTTTRSLSPDLRTDEERRQEGRLWKLTDEWAASLPSRQLKAEKEEERERICQNHDNRIRPLPYKDSWLVAKLNVKQRWMEQGIWDDEYEWPGNGRWKHEKQIPSDNSTAAARGLLSSIFTGRRDGRPKQATVDSGQTRNAEEREHQASRPLYQFFYQVSKKREHIQELLIAGDAPVSPEFDINTRAYNEVKRIWTKRGIWNAKWGILPGMTWKHEHSFKKLVREEFGADYEPPTWSMMVVRESESEHCAEEKPLPPPPECNRPKEDELREARFYRFCAEPSEFVKEQLDAAREKDQRQQREHAGKVIEQIARSARQAGRPNIFQGLFIPRTAPDSQASTEAHPSHNEPSTRSHADTIDVNAHNGSSAVEPLHPLTAIRKSTRRQKRPPDSNMPARGNRKRPRSDNGPQEAEGRRKQPARACKRKPTARC
ncbi:hypothetical protein F5Y18DRAFT_8724 [Xylariaceae sp. FL1019]|nr:hypothetical protein F5Y18DRAFT_8724 [Xylariaceae sp. FL1019]